MSPSTGEYCQGTLTRIGVFGASIGILTDKVIAFGDDKGDWGCLV